MSASETSDLEVFVTPPTSPSISRTNSIADRNVDMDFSPTGDVIRASLSRRGSKPSVASFLPSLQTNIAWEHDIAVEQSPARLVGNKVSPDGQTFATSPTEADAITSMYQPPDTGAPQVSISSSPSSFNSIPLAMDSSHPPNRSPCFVHSHLDKGASLQDWLRAKENKVLGVDVGVARSLQQPQRPRYHDSSAATTPVDFPCRDATHMMSGSEDDDDPHSGSLTRQLAETAVGVREMSKQLGRLLCTQCDVSGSLRAGRARIRANIQSVLIVTKARDNRLIELTRELALYLMLRPRHSHRGLIV